ncbi:dynein heavy chain 1, axonemal [Plakobranchus ocellatus]|uniref:Dynein heavy chain 1, axonemal n=1 Tax=Plakobranchus ocellatus TaxID=259542 RepID=A0AAV4DM14_9GAST|nr:dynein heavy chain 1, axonemal [Plakobranchus ocellatus]
MAEHSEMEKAHEYANEMRRMYKNLRECQELAHLYNSREKLFKLKPTNFSYISKIMKEFEPFRKLWITTSDWVRWHESWLSDPLCAINAEELERCVAESWKTMNNCTTGSRINQDKYRELQTVRAAHSGLDQPWTPSKALGGGGAAAAAAAAAAAGATAAATAALIQNQLLLDNMFNNLLGCICNILKMSNEIGVKLKSSPNLTFTKCLEMKLEEHIDTIAKVSEIAAKEYAIELVSR